VGKISPRFTHTVAAILDWPKAIHDRNGKAVFIVPPSVTDAQLEVLA
jgi:hypothetical protein